MSACVWSAGQRDVNSAQNASDVVTNPLSEKHAKLFFLSLLALGCYDVDPRDTADKCK